MRGQAYLRGPGLGERDGEGQFATLQRIENGVLVHYDVAAKHRRRMLPGVHLAHGPESYEERDRVMESWLVVTRTVYCKDMKEVFAAVETAAKASEEITRLEKEGKFMGPDFVESA